MIVCDMFDCAETMHKQYVYRCIYSPVILLTVLGPFIALPVLHALFSTG